MYVPSGASVDGQDQALHQILLVLTSSASLVVLALATLLCGMCYCFGGSKPDYDDDDDGDGGFRNSTQEQKRPILNRSASLGSKKVNARVQSPVFVHQSSLRPDESSDADTITTYGTVTDSTVEADQLPGGPRRLLGGAAGRATPTRSVEEKLSQTSFETERVGKEEKKASNADDRSTTLPSDSSNKRTDTPTKKSVMFRSMSVDPASFPFERPKPKVGVEHVQPDANKLVQGQLSQTTANGNSDALGLALGIDVDAVPFGEELGKIQFSLMYDFPDQTLILRIVKANDLPAKDFSGTSDPFVKIMLLPDKKVKMETKVKRKNLNPIWNESFHFEGYPYAKIQTRVLHLQVLDYDRFSRNDPIGEVNLPLAEVDLTHEKLYWRALTPSRKSSGKLGSLLVSLCYAPTAGRITISILKCQNLAAKDITGKSDPYVKIWHMYKEKRIEKKKTIIKYHTLNPVYNESFVFNIPLDRIRETTFVISVVDKDRLSKNDMIGGILLGARASPAEMCHWNEMMSKPRTNIAKWHVLKGVN